MKISDPRVEIIAELKPLKRIELCGRVCYKSEDRITEDSAIKFVGGLIKRGHTSVLEHSRIVIDSPYELNFISRRVKKQQKRFNAALQHTVARMGLYNLGFSTMNVRDYLVFFPDARLEEINAHEDAADYMTVRFVCDRAIANELVRHRVFSFSQESTRYVNYKDGIEFIRPLPFDAKYPWTVAIAQAEESYRQLIQQGASPQEARNVLPLSTKTELIMTGTHSQWEQMLALRLSKEAHPQIRHMMRLLINHEGFPHSEIQLSEEANRGESQNER